MGIRTNVLLFTCGALIATGAARDVRGQAVAGSGQSVESAYSVIGYGNEAEANPVARLSKRLKSGEVQLEYRQPRGYLDSFLDALGIDPSSQVLVYSKTSLQHPWIDATTPRAIYFNEDTYVAWVQGTDILEITTMDSALGMVFYIFNNKRDPQQFVEREDQRCLNCHDTYGMMGGGVPELLARSSIVSVDGKKLTETLSAPNTTDRTPLEDRWGGWYVTGQHGDQTHLGNLLLRDTADLAQLDEARRGNLDSLDELNFLDTGPYLRTTSDIVALMVLEHQITVQNRLAYVKFKAPAILRRMGLGDATLSPTWDDLPEEAQRMLPRMLDQLVERMLFVDAAPLEGRITGSPEYEAWFQAQGPRDGLGRSLRDFDLEKRLFRYPLSYLVYSKDFDTLPSYARDYVYRKLAAILENRDRSETYAHISKADRRAILEILMATKPDFSQYVSARPD